MNSLKFGSILLIYTLKYKIIRSYTKREQIDFLTYHTEETIFFLLISRTLVNIRSIYVGIGNNWTEDHNKEITLSPTFSETILKKSILLKTYL